MPTTRLYNSSSAAPTTSDIPAGTACEWYNTTAGTIGIYANINGQIVQIAVPISVGVPYTSYPMTDGLVYSNKFENGASIQSFTNCAFAEVTQPNTSTPHDTIAVLGRSLEWSSVLTSGQAIISLGSGVNLDDYDSILISVRDDSGLGQTQPFYVTLRDAAFTRIGGLPLIYPPGNPIGGGRAGLVRNFGGDTDGTMRQMLIPLGSDNATLTASPWASGGSPYKPFWGGLGIGLAAAPGRGTAYYLQIDNNSGGSRSGKTYLCVIRFVRKVAANMPAAISAYGENDIPLNFTLNYVPPLDLGRSSLPTPFTGTSDTAGFLPYWQKALDGQAYNGVPVAGTTEQILEYVARYWGFAPGTVCPVTGNGPPALTVGGAAMIRGAFGGYTAADFTDFFKAQAQQETNWREGTQSDYEQQTETINSTSYTWYGYASFGIGQQKWKNWGPHGASMYSTLWSALYKGAIVRAIVNGALSDFAGMTPNPTGNVRLALDAYYQGTGGSISETDTYPNNILGATGSSPEGFINRRDWNNTAASGLTPARTWPRYNLETV